MKKLLCSILVIISSFTVFGQAQDKGEFSFNINYDLGVHGTLYTSKYKGDPVNGPDSSAAGTQMVRINAHYNLLKWLSIGLDLRAGSYLEDPENATADGNKVNMWGLGLRLYPINRDKFVWYLGTTLGGSRLEINRIYTFLVAIPTQYNFKSPHFGLETGFNWYFAKNFGMNFGLGYSSQNFKMTEYYLNGDSQDLTDFENTLLTKGVHANIGLAFHF